MTRPPTTLPQDPEQLCVKRLAHANYAGTELDLALRWRKHRRRHHQPHQRRPHFGLLPLHLHSHPQRRCGVTAPRRVPNKTLIILLLSGYFCCSRVVLRFAMTHHRAGAQAWRCEDHAAVRIAGHEASRPCLFAFGLSTRDLSAARHHFCSCCALRDVRENAMEPAKPGPEYQARCRPQ